MKIENFTKFEIVGTIRKISPAKKYEHGDVVFMDIAVTIPFERRDGTQDFDEQLVPTYIWIKRGLNIPSMAEGDTVNVEGRIKIRQKEGSPYRNVALAIEAEKIIIIHKAFEPSYTQKQISDDEIPF